MSYLKKIEIKNFLGISKYEHEFSEGANFILAKSGSGKSTIAKADCWIKNLSVLFEPKINGKKIINLETSVKETYIKDGQEHSFKCTAKPLYSPRQGEIVKVFDKYEYHYFYNNCNLRPSEYEKKLVDFFETSDHQELQIVTLNSYFNTDNNTQWSNTKRQSYLFNLFDFDNKMDKLLSEYNLIVDDIKVSKLKEEEIKANITSVEKEIAKQQFKNNDTIAKINKEKNELKSIDFKTLKVERDKYFEEIARLQSEKFDDQVVKEINDKTVQIGNLENQISLIEQAYKKEFRDYQNAIINLRDECGKLETDKKICELKIKKLKSSIDDFEIELEQAQEEIFDEKNNYCTKCKQELPIEEKERLSKHFEEEKETTIAELRLKTEKATLETQATIDRANTLNESITALATQETDLIKHKPQPKDTADLQNNIINLQKEIENLRNNPKDDTVAETIKAKQMQYDGIVETLGGEKKIIKLEAEALALKKENRDLANTDSDMKRKLLQFNEYKKCKNELLDTTINKNFEKISFSFIEQQGKGSQFGEKETCECMWGENNESKRLYSNLSGGEKVLADFLLNYNLRKIRNLNFPQFTDEVSQRTTDMEIIEKEFLVNKVDWQTIYILIDDEKTLNAILIKDVYDEKDCNMDLIQ